MNLNPLFEIQKPLRNKIIEQHDLQDCDLMENHVLAFQVELSELANEWRGFKHWSNDQEMRREKALEEFADCMAFLLELGLELDIPGNWDVSTFDPDYEATVQKQFIAFNQCLVANMDVYEWHEVVSLLLGLGLMLGFTEEEMIEAYLEKNKINHERQESGY